MKARWPVVLMLLLWLLSGAAQPVRADGIIIPPPCPLPSCPPPPCQAFDCPPWPPRPIEQLDIRYHHVTVSIHDQLAVTHVDQVFYNPNDWAIEGTYVFPLPMDAVVSDFTLWVDGKPVKGEVLDAEQARQYYDEMVRSLRDPALLEYEGRGAVKASVFPIEPQGERRIELEYTQLLTAENGLVRYIYPLNTEKFSLKPLEDVSVRVEIDDQQAIRAVYSPSHPVDLIRSDDQHATVQYQAKDVRPDSDFSLFYSIGESQAFHLFSYRNPADPTDPDGFFLMLLAPKPGDNQVRVSKDVLLVLDRSGSMEGEKFQQAQAALRFILQRLDPSDRFYLQTFSSQVDTFSSGLSPASAVPQALDWLDRLGATGSTDINRALLEAAAVVDPTRPTYLIFLTDGLPTEGETNIQKILNNAAGVVPPNLRLFPFGVGYDVNTVLLDTLSQTYHGQSTYVRPGEALDEAISGFYERISQPVLTDLKLDFGDLATYDIYPNPLPDLFSGGQVVVTGRYRGGGAVDITLTGNVNNEPQTFHYPDQLLSPDSTADASGMALIPRLWATRKIGYLLNHIRLKGADKETIQQIVALSVRYGIVTPYTSYLVTEPQPLGAEAQNKIADNVFGQGGGSAPQATGKGAVDRAAQEGQLQSADAAPLSPGAGSRQSGSQQSAGPAIRTVGVRTFLLQNGVWVDTTYDPKLTPTQPVVFLSDDYFKLLKTQPDLGPVLALGEQVIVVVKGQAYQVTVDAHAAVPLTPPPPVPPVPTPEKLNGTAEPALVITPAPPSATLTVGVAPPAPAAPSRLPFCLGGLLPLAVLLAALTLMRLTR